MTAPNNQTGRLSPQSTLQQRYIIVDQIGRGGMGAVYQATDTRVGNRRIAIKEMSQAHLSTQELAQASIRFQQEAHMLGSLSHTNLPHIYDSFSEQGRSYLVMDFIEGQTLYKLLKDRDGQPLPVSQALLYAQQLCDVLSYLHRQNPPIVFRDIKPTNIMVTNNGHVYLIDFGIARFFKEGQEQDTILLGSPGYAPPEQHGLAQTGPRSDLYGLGATLHYCLTGNDPYYAQKHFSFAPVRQYNPQVPVELDQLIQRMVAYNEQERPASALEVLQTLNAISQQATDHTTAINPASMAPTNYIRPYPQPTTVPVPGGMTGPANPHAPTEQMHLASSAFPVSKPSQVPTWTKGFTTTFGLFLALTVGSSIIAFNFICPSAQPLETIFSFLLLGIIIVAAARAKTIVSRSILLFTGFTTLVASFALSVETIPAFSHGFAFAPSSCQIPLLADLPLYNVLLTTGLVATSLISFYWLTRQTSTGNRLLLLTTFGVAILCAIIQAFFSESALNESTIKHLLLITALIALVQGMLLASQIARSQNTALSPATHGIP